MLIKGRCGKSTLLHQLLKREKNYFYCRFEDSRLSGFAIEDYPQLDVAFHETFGKSDVYFFDEIQNIPSWEIFVRSLLERGKKCYITGSNASLLSKELGTRLTGRHLDFELFPFSYVEMLQYTSKSSSAASFEKYLTLGGFPEFLFHKQMEPIQEIFNDVLLRDIVVRYGLREIRTLQELARFLISNTGKEFSYNKLAKMLDVSVMTIIAYVSYLEEAYLLFTLPKFSFSYQKQLVNPKKIYVIDNGFAAANSASFSGDKGRLLENAVFLHLRRKYKELFYFKGKKECDFLVREKGKITRAVQVCWKVTEENKTREIEGLQEALQALKLENGAIITFDQEDKLGNIELIPAWKFFLTAPKNL
ncbi:ATP-binding protein [Candidatus Woesearchaeota archaeon]|nr:ATP-binding protein [Candidatus Woesearchaeota archaeon]